MESTHVTSTNILKAGHADNTLYLQFHSGCCYAYNDTPHSVYHALIKAESVGKFFHNFIKGKYHYVKLDHDPFAVGAEAQKA